ncbi:XK-related protein 7-like [Schistocerca cancellata]|uniref:XK-related protein 7-like n=1 Tax=Schistocerca cancellata TaxID=274614 RepID=UPI0021181717|nr:XK-related protein 7-like [Schistocerca cancellata]
MAECVVVKFGGDRGVCYGDDGNSNLQDEMHNSTSYQTFGIYHAVCIALSIVTYVVDVVLHCWLAYFYLTQGHGAYFAYFGLTVTFLVVPALISTAFSMRWYINDVDEPSLPKPPLWKWVVRIIMLLLQLAPLLRYFDTLSYGCRSVIAGKLGNGIRQQKLYRIMLDEDSDASLLRLFHCFLHSFPQAVLQLMILLSAANIQETSPVQGLQSWAVACSLISIAWSLTSYHRSVRFARDDKEKLAWQGAVMQFCWHLLSAVSRVLALSLLAALYPAWMGMVCLAHWMVMSAWLALSHQPTAVCTSRCEELLFSAALGFAYILTFVAPRDGPTRYSYLAYYLVFFMENTGALVVWCVSSNSAQNPILYYGAVVVQTTAFLLAIFFMLTYYRHFHPSGTTIRLSKSIAITDPGTELKRRTTNQ